MALRSGTEYFTATFEGMRSFTATVQLNDENIVTLRGRRRTSSGIIISHRHQTTYQFTQNPPSTTSATTVRIVAPISDAANPYATETVATLTLANSRWGATKVVLFEQHYDLRPGLTLSGDECTTVYHMQPTRQFPKRRSSCVGVVDILNSSFRRQRFRMAARQSADLPDLLLTLCFMAARATMRGDDSERAIAIIAPLLALLPATGAVL